MGRIIKCMTVARTKESFLKAIYKGSELPIGCIGDNSCRYCRKSVSEDQVTITQSYWSSIWQVSHKSCDQQGRKDEAYECQILDADCNDCKHFKRGPRYLYHGDKTKTEEGYEYTKILVAYDIFHGECLRFNKITTAFVNMASGHECFEHRRSY